MPANGNQKQLPRPDFPLFQRFTLDQLAKKTPYSLRYLISIEEGVQAAPPRFRETCSKCLHIPEADLFEPANPAYVQYMAQRSAGTQSVEV